jgi:hypothetical protein
MGSPSTYRPTMPAAQMRYLRRLRRAPYRLLRSYSLGWIDLAEAANSDNSLSAACTRTRGPLSRPRSDIEERGR